MITLIAVCGLGGSGKSTLGEYLKSNLAIPYYHIGQILVDECNRLQIEPTRENKKLVGEKTGVVDKYDSFHFFEESYAYMRSVYKHPCLVFFDAIRSTLELNYLREKENVLLVGVLVDKNERYKRLRYRQLKNRRSMSNQEIYERDLIELGLGKDHLPYFNVGTLLGLSDIFISTTASQFNIRPYNELVDYIINLTKKNRSI
jgi:dephospho-CoA kinase